MREATDEDGRSRWGGVPRRELWAWVWCTAGIVWLAGSVVPCMRAEEEWPSLLPPLFCAVVAGGFAAWARRKRLRERKAKNLRYRAGARDDSNAEVR